MRSLLSIACLGLLLIFPSLLHPQEFSEEREKVKERIETIRMWKMMNTLDLSREQSEKIFPLLQEIEERRRMLFEERGRAMRELEETVRGEHPDEGAVVALMERIEQNQEEMEKLRREEKKSLGSILSPLQQGRYLIFKETFERELRSIIRDAKRPPARWEGEEPEGFPGRVPPIPPDE